MSDNRKAACVVGWPASHSRSPLIHQYWMRKYNIDAEYRKEAIPPDQFADFIGHLRERGYVGCNVTVPHKQAAMELTIADDRARAVGAANTLWFDGDKLRSTNTDVEGFLANLDQMTPGWDRGLESAVVLGAGGGARAVVFALLQREVQHVHVVNRSPERAEALREQFGSRIRVAQWGEMTGLLGGAGLLVNTTSLGMVGLPKIEINLRCQPSMVVADLVYVPLETALLAAARDKGLRTADGLGMLLHQAVRGFELWFGVKPEVTPELRKLIEDDLAAEGLEATAEAKAAKAKQKDKHKNLDKPKVRGPKKPRPPKGQG
ncbi:MAG: shikimate dehydrogenase [Proteobacteria bacterium]|nr:shikimate dehydrogenase [Pseudomonadota bacterium]